MYLLKFAPAYFQKVFYFVILKEKNVACEGDVSCSNEVVVWIMICGRTGQNVVCET